MNNLRLVSLPLFQANKNNDCFVLPSWVYVLSSVSVLLMAANSSTNFFVYCLVNATFRRELMARAGPVKRLLKLFGRPKKEREGEEHPLNEQARPLVVVTSAEGGGTIVGGGSSNGHANGSSSSQVDNV